MKTRGKMEENAEKAPILVFAPHTSWADVLTVVLCKSSFFGEEEIANLPFFKSLSFAALPILVSRKKGTSRKTAR